MSHLWKIDLYKVLMFPGCFREDLVAGGRHSSWGTKPFRRILSKTCLSFKKLKDSKKKKKTSKVNQKQNPTHQIIPTHPTPNLRAMFAPGSAPPLFLHPLARHRIGRRAVARLLEVISGEVEGNEGGPGVLVVLGGFGRSTPPIFVRKWWWWS